MDVGAIISNIAFLSSNEDVPDADEQARILKYVNLAHEEVYQRTAVFNSNRLAQTETVSLTSGSGTMVTEPFKVLSAVDVTNNRILEARHIEELEEEYPALDDVGDPKWYYTSGIQTLNCYPMGSQDIRVRFIAMPTSLALGGAESTIPYPKPYHRVLVMGGLYYMYQDERDFRTIQEIAQAKADFKETLNEMAQHLSINARRAPRTKFKDF